MDDVCKKDLRGDLAKLAIELLKAWPAGKKTFELREIDANGNTLGDSIRFGDVRANPGNVLKVTESGQAEDQVTVEVAVQEFFDSHGIGLGS